MRYEILGPLRVLDGEDVLMVTAPKVEVLLATLLIRAGQVVSLDQLVTEVWNHNPPRRATDALYVYISQLRKLLGRNGRKPIQTRAPGYRLVTEEGELDLHVFQRLVNEGRAAHRDGRHAAAADAFGAALALWQGPALDELRDGPVITGFVTWLEETRLECTEKMIESNLVLGRHREVVGMLYGLIADHPLHEAFYRQLMTALYRSERRGDALRVYRTARGALQDQLGLEPGRALRELQQSILLADDVFDARPAV
ncbi:BTAD domain-containing putative transcriptional regulator [Kitasatospora sp. NPDC059408]|uniref:AfsR/SARP family transcriptional regulator n=1 Tax=Kitasatospora sp. NPDC059408 TaxID=3346823 RepID=UPI00369950BA